MKQMRRKKPITKDRSFPIVAIGASAGGLEAVSALLENLPPDTGMAYLYVQHLSPDYPSNLASILSASTKMPVQEVGHLLKIEPDNVYVCTPNKEIKVNHGKIELMPRHSEELPYLPIDEFFISLSEKYKEKAIGIILSGNATDGTRGLKAIRDAGGLTFAQDGSAKYGSMPKSAINKDAADFILSPKKIAKELTRFSKNSFLKHTKQKKLEDAFEGSADLKTVFEILHKETGVDFNRYKMTSIKRRLNHRMLQSGVKTIKEYIKVLEEKKDEPDILYKDLLINVTGFFRDKEVFQYLKSVFLPKLLKSRPPGETIRIWVPACSTGEEAYSIAMLIIELQDRKTSKIPVQIFATDLSEEVIRDARIGEYTQSDIVPVSQQRVKRFFTKMGDRYRVVKELREMCVFAPHNILSDPPFFRIDFISCRNLLIYFDAVAQKRVFATIHFALNDGGFLMLGKAESIGASSHLFTQIHAKFRLYSRKKNTGVQKVPELTRGFSKSKIAESKMKPIPRKTRLSAPTDLDHYIDTLLLSHYMPACAIINKNMEILQFRGSTSLYLSHPSGKASLNILKMLRPEIAFELRNSINKAVRTDQRVCKSGIGMSDAGNSVTRIISIEINPLKIEWDEPLFLIVFSLQGEVQKGGEKKNSNSTEKDRRIKKLTEELNYARAEMHAIIELQEKAYEELQVANEEIVSTNEEFQTLNEELETTKEEIEATNEELISTNRELQVRNDLLAESYEYSQTIIATIHEPMIILDHSLHIKFANNSFYKKFQLSSKETEGMPLSELGNKEWNIPKLFELLKDMLSNNTHFENFEITQQFSGIGTKVMLLNANRIIQKTHREKLILLAIQDITEHSIRQRQHEEYLKKDIVLHQRNKLELERAVKRRTNQLEQKNIELETLNKDLTTFTYVSSHDLQEPLRKIQTFVTYLLTTEESNLSDNGREYFKRLQGTAKRMQILIEDLLAYSRATTSERNFIKTDLNKLLIEVKNDIVEGMFEKEAIIQAKGLCEINVIPFQFRQLMYNLISNSLKFAKAGVAPEINIKSKIVSGKDLNVKNLSQNTRYCHIIYTDNGIGFDPQYKDRIFEVFQRLHTADQYTGTGIGLAICKRIVENHNGLITATGKLNKGARFDIYIPAD